MSKNYKEISSQVAAIQTSDHTMAFYACLEPVKPENFAELVDGRIKIGINDFSKGKGDAAVYGYYNLDLKDVKYLYTRALYCNMPIPFEGQKIHGAYPLQEGPYKGMCRSFHIVIKRTAVRSDGQPSRFPWNVTISNGVAQAKEGKIRGTFFEERGTFQCLTYVYMNLSDVDFLDCMDKINTYIREYTRLISNKLIPEGVKALKEVRERNSYQSEMQPETPSQTQNAQPQKDGSTPPQQKEVMPELHPTTLLIQSEFQALDGGRSIAKCLVKGKYYNIFFDQINDELIAAQMQQIPITLNLYLDRENRFRCHSVAVA